MLSASGKRGLITHLKGIGRLYHEGHEHFNGREKIIGTHSIRPMFTKPSVSGIMGFPQPSSMGLIVAAHNKRAIIINMELLATCRPGHILRV